MADLKPKVLSANGPDKLLDDGDNLVSSQISDS